jgi:hypothetical protein
MNHKTKIPPKSKAERGPCLCEGAGPALSDLLRRLGPPEPARRHFQAARVELLKGLRALIDARLERLSRPARKGEKIEVE